MIGPRALCLWMESVWLLRPGSGPDVVWSIRLGFLGPSLFCGEDPSF